MERERERERKRDVKEENINTGKRKEGEETKVRE
jgi:hypothetical protein